MMRANMQGMSGLKGILLKHGEKIGLSLIGLVVAWFIYSSIGRERLPEDQPQKLASLVKTASDHMGDTTWDQLDTEYKKIALAAKPSGEPMKELQASHYPKLPSFDTPVIPHREPRRDPILLTVAELEVHPGAGIIAHVDEEVMKKREEAARIEEEKQRKEEEKKRDSETEPGEGRSPYGDRGYGGEGRGGYGGEGRGGYGSRGGYGQGMDRGTGRRGGGGLLEGGGRGGAYAGDDPNVRPIDMAVSMEGYVPDGTERYDLTYWNCIVGKVPIKKQIKEFSNALHNTYNYDPSIDFPSYEIYQVERKEITGSGASEWQKVKPRDPKTKNLFPYVNYDVLVKLQWDWPTSMEPVVGDQYIDPLLTFPLPPVVGHGWGKDATHSDIPLFDPATLPADQNREDLEEDDSQDMPLDEDTFVSGSGDDTTGNFRGGRGGYGGLESGRGGVRRPGMPGGRSGYGGYGEEGMTRGRGGYGGRGGIEGGVRDPYGGRGIAGRGGYGGREMGGRGGYGSRGMGAIGYGMIEETEFLLFRFFDFDVQPGKTYQYRVRLVVADPNHNTDKRFLAPEVLERRAAVEQKNKGNLPYRLTEWSEPSAAVGVSLPGQVLAGKVNPASQSSHHSEPAAGWIVTSFDGNTAEELIAEEERVYRGSVGNVSVSDGWVIAPSRGELHRKKDYLVRTGVVMIDMFGGERLDGSRDMTIPGQVLLMDPSGRMVIRNELEDAGKVAFYHQLLEEEVERERANESGDRRGGEEGLLAPPGGGRGGGRGGRR